MMYAVIFKKTLWLFFMLTVLGIVFHCGHQSTKRNRSSFFCLDKQLRQRAELGFGLPDR
jgi:hypothetical protein